MDKYRIFNSYLTSKNSNLKNKFKNCQINISNNINKLNSIINNKLNKCKSKYKYNRIIYKHNLYKYNNLYNNKYNNKIMIIKII